MPSDIAIDNNGDLIFGGNRDYSTVSGTAQIQQRIRARVLLPIGSVMTGDDNDVGSDIHHALRLLESDERAFDDIALRIQEALAPIDEIVVHDVQITVTDHRTLDVAIVYTTVINETDEEADVATVQEEQGDTLTMQFTGED